MNKQNPVIPSDFLMELRELIADFPILDKVIGNIFQLRIVIDTNIILSELIWLTKRRKTPNSRSNLQEAIASGTVIAFAPEKLLEEVEKNIPYIASEEGIPEVLLFAEWQIYQKYLRICLGNQSNMIDNNQIVRDPNDLPFIHLFFQLEANAIFSKDKDVPSMLEDLFGVESGIITKDTIRHLRDFARAESLAVTIKLVGVTIGGTSIGILIGAANSVKALGSLFIRLPKWLQLALIAASGIIAIHPKGRLAISQSLLGLSNKLRSIANWLRPLLIEVMEAYKSSAMKVANELESIQKALPPRRKVTLKTMAYSVCLAAGHPLSLSEIEKGVRFDGYKSKSLNLRAYLARVMRQDRRFTRRADGCWTVIKTQQHR